MTKRGDKEKEFNEGVDFFYEQICKTTNPNLKCTLIDYQLKRLQ